MKEKKCLLDYNVYKWNHYQVIYFQNKQRKHMLANKMLYCKRKVSLDNINQVETLLYEQSLYLHTMLILKTRTRYEVNF